MFGGAWLLAAEYGTERGRPEGVNPRHLPAHSQPIAGWLPGAEGLYVAVTHSGVTLGLHLAELICAELVTGAAAAELAPYRPDRFAASA